MALARALAKKAPLMLLDEPLVNLDYKLREELRDELSQLFATGESTVVYATTEPTEALLLGGYTAVLDAGELLQYGPTAEVFHRPRSMRVARAFSDPPMNLIAGRGRGGRRRAARRADPAAAAACPATPPPGADGRRPRQRAARAPRATATSPARHGRAGRDLGLRHLRARRTRRSASWSRSCPACTSSRSAQPITLYLNPAQVYVFDADGDLLRRARGATAAEPR